MRAEQTRGTQKCPIMGHLTGFPVATSAGMGPYTNHGHSPCFVPGVSSISLWLGVLRPLALSRPDGRCRDICLLFVSPGTRHPSPLQTEEELGHRGAGADEGIKPATLAPGDASVGLVSPQCWPWPPGLSWGS